MSTERQGWLSRMDDWLDRHQLETLRHHKTRQKEIGEALERCVTAYQSLAGCPRSPALATVLGNVDVVGRYLTARATQRQRLVAEAEEELATPSRPFHGHRLKADVFVGIGLVIPWLFSFAFVIALGIFALRIVAPDQTWSQKNAVEIVLLVCGGTLFYFVLRRRWTSLIVGILVVVALVVGAFWDPRSLAGLVVLPAIGAGLLIKKEGVATKEAAPSIYWKASREAAEALDRLHESISFCWNGLQASENAAVAAQAARTLRWVAGVIASDLVVATARAQEAGTRSLNQQLAEINESVSERRADLALAESEVNRRRGRYGYPDPELEAARREAVLGEEVGKLERLGQDLATARSAARRARKRAKAELKGMRRESEQRQRRAIDLVAGIEALFSPSASVPTGRAGRSVVRT